MCKHRGTQPVAASFLPHGFSTPVALHIDRLGKVSLTNITLLPLSSSLQAYTFLNNNIRLKMRHSILFSLGYVADIHLAQCSV